MGKILEDDNGRIVEFFKKIKVVACGKSAHVVLPKKLRGKMISVHYKRKEKKYGC